MITKKQRKASRFHNVRCLMRSAMRRFTTYTRKHINAGYSAASAIIGFFARLLAFILRLFTRPVEATA